MPESAGVLSAREETPEVAVGINENGVACSVELCAADTAQGFEQRIRVPVNLEFQVSNRRGVLQAGYTTLDHHAAFVDYHHVFTKIFDQVELVRAEDDRFAIRRLFTQRVRHCLDRDGIEPGERFVKYQKVRVVNQSRRQLYSLLVAV